MSAKTLALMGSTGSVGQNTLDVVSRFPDRFRIHALAAHSNIDKPATQIETFRPKLAVVYDQADAEALRQICPDHGRPAGRGGRGGLVGGGRGAGRFMRRVMTGRSS